MEVATPDAESVLAPPRLTPSTVNWTVPLGTAPVPALDRVTVAVNVTDCPWTEGLTLLVTTVAAAAFVMVTVPAT